MIVKSWKPFGAAMLALLLLVSCTPAEGMSTADNPESAEPGAPVRPEDSTAGDESNEEVVIRFSWWGADTRHGPYLDTFDVYEQAHPHVTLEPEYSGWDGYQEKLMTQLAGGQEPDIMTLDAPWCPELANRADYFVDFYSQDILDYSDIDRTLVTDFGEFNGKLIALPLGLQSTALMINKTVADAHGIDTEKHYTWEELLEVGRELHSQNSDMYLFNADRGHVGGIVRAMLKELSGSQLFLEDYTVGFREDDLLTAYNWVVRAYEAGLFENLGDSELFYGVVEQNPNWINQKQVMAVDWNGTIIRFASTLEEGTEMVGRLYPTIGPQAKDGSAIIRPIFMAAVSNNSAHINECLTFLNWFINDTEAAVSLGSAKGVPATNAQIEAASSAGVIEKGIVEGLEAGLTNPSQKENALSTDSELSAVFTDEISKVAFGELSAEEGVASTMKALGDKLEQLKNN